MRINTGPPYKGSKGRSILGSGSGCSCRAGRVCAAPQGPGRASLGTCFVLAAGAVYVLGRVWAQLEVEAYGLAIAGFFVTTGAEGLAQATNAYRLNANLRRGNAGFA
jgi:hypothetical protein